jgi:DNA-binding GntR family transcriptional regulator
VSWADTPTLGKVLQVSAPVRRQVVELLRQAIIQGDLPPGTRLIERELCEQTGVSRTAIREALRQLEAESLVTNTPRGPAVATLSKEEAAQLYEARASLESLVTGLFCLRATPEEIVELRLAQRTFGKFTKKPADLRGLLAAKQSFYDILILGARNEVAASLLRSLHARIMTLRALSMDQPGRPLESDRELAEIVTAIEERDVDRARKATAAHVKHASMVVLGHESDASVEIFL